MNAKEKGSVLLTMLPTPPLLILNRGVKRRAEYRGGPMDRQRFFRTDTTAETNKSGTADPIASGTVARVSV